MGKYFNCPPTLGSLLMKLTTMPRLETIIGSAQSVIGYLKVKVYENSKFVGHRNTILIIRL